MGPGYQWCSVCGQRNRIAYNNPFQGPVCVHCVKYDSFGSVAMLDGIEFYGETPDRLYSGGFRLIQTKENPMCVIDTFNHLYNAYTSACILKAMDHIRHKHPNLGKARLCRNIICDLGGLYSNISGRVVWRDNVKHELIVEVIQACGTCYNDPTMGGQPVGLPGAVYVQESEYGATKPKSTTLFIQPSLQEPAAKLDRPKGSEVEAVMPGFELFSSYGVLR